MPADYSSTARALAVSGSPPLSPSVSRQPFRPQWRRSQSSSSRLTGGAGPRSRINQLLHSAERIQKHTMKIIKKMTLWQRILAGLALLILNVLGILFLVFNEKVFAWLAPIAATWRDLKAGWLIVWALIFVTAFPPIIGYATSVTIAGFIYGLPNGWYIAASSSVVGSMCSIIISRTIFAGYVQRLVSNDKRFTALALTLKHDGLKLLVMIRLCPLPYSISNGAMSTIPTVDPLMYGLATGIASIKLILPVFIGGRLADIAERGAKMDAGTKAINYISIAISGILGVVIGWVIYQRTLSRAAQLEAEERARLNISSEEAVGSFSDDYEEDDVYVGTVDDQGDDISLFEATIPDEAYRDEDTDDDVFAYGDSDVEQTAGLDKEGRRSSS